MTDDASDTPEIPDEALTAAEASDDTADRLGESILRRKVGQKPPKRERALFAPDMVADYCDRLGDTFSALFDARVRVRLDEITLHPLQDTIEAFEEPMTAGFIALNGAIDVAFISLDMPMLYHMVDLSLGGDPSESPEPVARPASTLDDGLTRQFIDAALIAFGASCRATMGEASYSSGACRAIIHDPEALTIVPRKAETLNVGFVIEIAGARRGVLEFCIPMGTIDTVFSSAAGGSSNMPNEGDPWFEHMKSSVMEMELETYGYLHEIRMSFAQLSRLSPGDIIEIPQSALEDVPVLLEDGDDEIALGKLGASNGNRTVRLHKPPVPEFFEPMAKLIDVV